MISKGGSSYPNSFEVYYGRTSQQRRDIVAVRFGVKEVCTVLAFLSDTLAGIVSKTCTQSGHEYTI